MKRNWVYDLEVFPNFFSATFIEFESDETVMFIIYKERNDLPKFIEFIEKQAQYLVGYNSSKYDDIIVRFLCRRFDLLDLNASDITNIIFELSKDIIGSQSKGNSIWRNEKLKPYINPDRLFKSIDLMSMMAFDKNRIGLKKVAVAMKWPTIQDLPKPFDEIVNDNEVADIMKYNENDVLITKQLMLEQQDELQVRIDVGRLYGIDLMSDSRARMADKLMSKFWEEETGQRYWDFKDQRTKHEFIALKECVSDKVGFKSGELKKLLTDIQNTLWYPTSKFEHHVVINKTKYDVLLGGLHSVRDPLIYEEDDEYELWDLDVASYYPGLMINLSIYPKHLSEQFLDLFKRLVAQRLDAKKKGDKKTADALKIVINSCYGKLNFEHGWMYDTKASYSVTLTGQLYLLMLVEALEMSGIEVFYANTDGLTCKIKKSMKPKFDELCEGWQKYTGLELEFAKYKKCVIRDVNNYIIQTDAGYLKTKGCFTEEIDMTKGYNNPVVPLALQRYFLDNISIETSIRTHENIYDFCKSQKVGAQYTQEYHDLNAERTDMVIHECQKTNRYYASKSTGKLYKKRKDNGQLNDLVAGHNVTLLNDVEDESKHAREYNIDYAYYIAQANKIVRVMEPTQMSLPF